MGSVQNALKTSGLALVNAKNYTSWQYEHFKKHVGDCILEIGCGLGNITQYLIKDAKYILSVDVKPEAVEFTKQRFLNRANLNVERFDVFAQGLGRYSGIEFNTIVFINVLEHIKDDLGAMRVCREILRKRGKLLLMVPAHGFLYGTLDAESGHYKRYSRGDIVRLARETGFSIRELYLFNFSGALGWFINYCVLKRKNANNSAGPFQMRWYDKLIVGPSRLVESKLKPPIGLSWVAALEVNNE